MVLISLLAGTISGYLYGLSHRIQMSKAHASSQASQITFARLSMLLVSRMFAFGIAFYFLLLSKTVQPILFIATFIVAFWFQVLHNRLGKHGTHQSPHL
jgi:hypothetical protein